MECQTLPIAYPVSRSAAERCADELQRLRRVLRELWCAWMKRRKEDSVLKTLASLDSRTLKDIGMPDEFRARAAALRETRYERITELMF